MALAKKTEKTKIIFWINKKYGKEKGLKI